MLSINIIIGLISLPVFFKHINGTRRVYISLQQASIILLLVVMSLRYLIIHYYEDGDEISGYFAEGASSTVKTCEACSRTQDTNGNVEGDKDCLDNYTGNPITCPTYANRACYTAGSTSVENNDAHTVKSYRGCSSFDIG